MLNGRRNVITAENMIDPLFLLRDLIQERTGLFFRDYQGLELIAARLKPRLEKKGCGSFTEYYRLLSEEKVSPASEWLHVIAQLSKPVSSFARHTDMTQLLVNAIIPQLLSNGDAKRLKIWSAGCATGEEPLMIAMTLSEAGWLDRIEVEIFGSDASFVAIEKARRGIYSESKVWPLAPELKSKYFTSLDEGWQVKPELHERIQWSVTNLIIESEMAELATSHIIFCRKVFIYFSESAIRQTLRLFEKQMPRGGCLLTDEGDYFISLMSQLNIFERQVINGVSIWVKGIGNAPVKMG